MKLKFIALSLVATSLIGYAQNGRYDTNNYTNHLEQNVYVRVTKSYPIYEDIREKTPYQECRNEKVRVENNRGRREDALGSLIGGVAGGILGHQVGKGRGNTAATIGGAILGTVIGQNVHKNRRARDDYYYENRQICETRYRVQNRKVLSGYNNIGYYNNQEIKKFSRNPMRDIPVKITISY